MHGKFSPLSGDLPVEKLVALAQQVLANSPPGSKAFFKSTCLNCGERVEFNEPNVVFEEMECCNCGHVQPFQVGGFSLHLPIGFDPTKGETADSMLVVTDNPRLDLCEVCGKQVGYGEPELHLKRCENHPK